MPRPTPPRTIAAEQALAQRIAWERKRRGQSYEGLASRMDKAGCPISGSGLYKIEREGRRITVDELVALARVWNMSVEDLLRPIAAILHADIAKAEQAEHDAWQAVFNAVRSLVEARAARKHLYTLAYEGDDPELKQAAEAFWEAQRQTTAVAKKQAAAAKKKLTGGLSGGFAARLAEFEAERENWTDEQRAEHERELLVDKAVGAVMDVVAPYDDVLGDSMGQGT